MRISFAAAVIIGSFFASQASAQTQTEEKPNFQIEIQPAAEGGPKFTVTNLSGKTLSACVLQLSITSEHKSGGFNQWDAVLQKEKALEPGQSLTQYLSHVVGGPLPDKVEVIAGIWADGETFGAPQWTKSLLDNRALRMHEYLMAVILLQKGLEEQWTRQQYLTGLDEQPHSAAAHAIKSTFMANQQLDEKRFEELVRKVLQHWNEELQRLRQAQPQES